MSRSGAAYAPSALPAGITDARGFDARAGVCGLGAGSLMRSKAKLAGTLTGSGTFRIAEVGDSKTAGYTSGNAAGRSTISRAAQLRTMLAARGYPVGSGAATCTDQTCTDSRVTTTGTGWAWAASGVYSYQYDTAAGDTKTFTSDRAGTVAEFGYLGPAGNTFSYQIDGGAAVNVTTPATGIGTITVTGLANTTHTIKITNVTPALLVVFWFDVYPPASVLVANFGLFGSCAAPAGAVLCWDDTAGQLAYDTLNVAASYNADLYTVSLGANDWGRVSAAQLRASLTAIATRLTAGGADLVFIVETPTSQGWAASWVQNIYLVADTLAAPVLDLYQRWGQSEPRAATLGLIGADGIHETPAGYNDAAVAELALLLAA